MDMYKLYQGYSFNKNQFFAPSLAKRTKTPELHSRKKGIVISKNLLRQLIIPSSKHRYIQKSSLPDNDIITPETLSYHINRNSLTSTPVPRVNRTVIKSRYFSSSSHGSPTRIEKSVLLIKHRQYKKSCDIGIQNVSTECINLPSAIYTSANHS